MVKFKNQKWIERLWKIMRLILGVIFIYASVDKIINPEQFAFNISNYRMLPGDWVNSIALLLPWFEATIGAFLIFGLFEWVSLTLYNLMMIIFMIAIGISLARGLNITCGCFTSDPNAEKMTWLIMFRDSLMLIPGILSYAILNQIRPSPFFQKKSAQTKEIPWDPSRSSGASGKNAKVDE